MLPCGNCAILAMCMAASCSTVGSVGRTDIPDRYVHPKEDKRKDIFYQDCSDDDVERARHLFRSESPVPGGTPVDVTEDNFGSVTRTYIECLHDHVISPSIQKKMYTELPCRRVVSMNTSHSPFLSAPEELARNLESLATIN